MPVVGDSLHLLVSQISPVPLSTGLEFVHPLLSALLSESPPLYHLSIVKSHSIGFDKPFHLKSIASSIPPRTGGPVITMPRPRLNSHVPWCLTQTFLRVNTLFLSFLSIVFFGAAAALYNDKILSIPQTGLDIPLITDLITIIPLACSCIWCGILITICLHSVACCSTMPHPGVIVSVDLIVWTGCRRYSRSYSQKRKLTPTNSQW
jgi:hypothetical protein